MLPRAAEITLLTWSVQGNSRTRCAGGESSLISWMRRSSVEDRCERRGEVGRGERAAGGRQTQYGTVRPARREVAAGDRRGIGSQRRDKGMR